MQFVARLAVFLRVADAVDRFVNDRAQVATPQLVDDVISRAEVAFFRFHDAEQSVEVRRRYLRKKRQFAQTIAKQRKEERIVVFRTAEDGNFVDKKVRRHYGDGESLLPGGGSALFEQALGGLDVRRVARVI